MTITGTGFTAATAVKFGTTAATSYNVVSGTLITAVSPAESAGIVDVTVTTSVGTSATSSADLFTSRGHRRCTSVSPVARANRRRKLGHDHRDQLHRCQCAASWAPPAATTYTVVSAVSITASSPARVGGDRRCSGDDIERYGATRRPTTSPTRASPTVQW